MLNNKEELSFERLQTLRKFNAAWKLLCADSSPFICSFLYKVFIQANRRSLSLIELTDELEHFLYVLQQKHPEEAPSRTAKEYIEIWSSPELPWLSQRYTGRTDMPEVDLTTDAEKALRWLENLQPRSFVGTESRLLTIYQLLKELNQKLETDPQRLIEDFEEKKRDLEEQISFLRRGHETARLAPTQIKERYYQLEDTATALLSDFRQVEENFRSLDRGIREKIMRTEKTKGAMIDDIFGEQDAITDSDQGRSFRAFWEFLIQTDRHQDFEEMLHKILREPTVSSLPDKRVLPQFKDFLVEAGHKVYVVNNTLNNQLSKYLADKGRAENKRIVELVSSIEKRALALREIAKPKNFFSVDELKPSFDLSLNRPLFTVKEVPPLEIPNLESTTSEDAVFDQLFEAFYVDENALRDTIERLLMAKDQISLEEVLRQHPPEKGIPEILTYLKIAETRQGSHISRSQKFVYTLAAPIENQTPGIKKIHCPVTLFQRTT